MQLKPEMKQLLDNIQLAGNPPYSSMKPADARSLHEKSIALDLPPVALPIVKDLTISLEKHVLLARLYNAQDKQGRKQLLTPVLLWLHGGGHVVGSVNIYDSVCRRLALLGECAVLSVEYRLAPEHKFPCAVEDSLSIYKWLLGKASSLGCDPSRIGIGGDSAGGNLAAVTCFQARDLGLSKPKCQLLIYPAVASHPDSQSHQTYAEGYLLDRKTIDWFQNNYVSNQGDRNSPLFAPLLNDNFNDLPSTYIALAECDPLHDEGTAFAVKLRLAGNDVTVKTWAGMTHAFFTMGAVLDDARLAVEEAGEFLKQSLAVE